SSLREDCGLPIIGNRPLVIHKGVAPEGSLCFGGCLLVRRAPDIIALSAGLVTRDCVRNRQTTVTYHRRSIISNEQSRNVVITLFSSERQALLLHSRL